MNLTLFGRFAQEIILDSRVRRDLQRQPWVYIQPTPAQRALVEEVKTECLRNGHVLPDTSVFNIRTVVTWLIGLKVEAAQGLSAALQMRDDIEHLDEHDDLTEGTCTDEITALPLTENGKDLIRRAVQFCLDHGTIPDCSGSCDQEIVSLSLIHQRDLEEKIGVALFRKVQAIAEMAVSIPT